MTRRELIQASLATAASMALPSFVLADTKKQVQVVRKANDHFELLLPNKPKLRIMQIADTHFGSANDLARAKDAHSHRLIRELIETHQPDYIFHTGDFINNDQDYPEYGSIDFMNELGIPWSVVFGNHDHPDGSPGQKSLDQYYSSLGKANVGFAEKQNGGRDYCYRIDLKHRRGKPVASLFAFNTGNHDSGMKVSDTQSLWFDHQIEADKSAASESPIYVMQHIPMIEYRDLFAQKLAIGRQGEGVCFEQDKGEIFAKYVASKRVKAVFCGHDHVNDYLGQMSGVSLIYGRCSGYSGYGDWERGARLIDIDTKTGHATSRVVLGKAQHEKPEWAKTLTESTIG